MPVGRSDPGEGIDFNALKAKAMEMLPADDADEQSEVVKEQAPEPNPTEVRVKGASDTTKETKTVEAPVTPVVTKAPVSATLTDDMLVPVIVDGEEQLLPWGEAKGKISGGLKFTKNMQDLAKQRTAFAQQQAEQTKLREDVTKYDTFLKDPKAILSYVQSAFPQLFQQPEVVADNPDEIATVGQARAIAQQQAAAIAEQIANVKTFVQNSIDNRQQELAHNAKIATHQTAINSTLADIYKTNPVLKAIPNSEDLIRFEVSQLYTPQMTEPEALEAFRTVAAGMVEDISKHYKANQKIEAVAKVKANLESHSIEPAGGAAPQPKPASFKDSSGQIDWKRVTQAARDFS